MQNNNNNNKCGEKRDKSINNYLKNSKAQTFKLLNFCMFFSLLISFTLLFSPLAQLKNNNAVISEDEFEALLGEEESVLCRDEERRRGCELVSHQVKKRCGKLFGFWAPDYCGSEKRSRLVYNEQIYFAALTKEDAAAKRRGNVVVAKEKVEEVVNATMIKSEDGDDGSEAKRTESSTLVNVVKWFGGNNGNDADQATGEGNSFGLLNETILEKLLQTVGVQVESIGFGMEAKLGNLDYRLIKRLAVLEDQVRDIKVVCDRLFRQIEFVSCTMSNITIGVISSLFVYFFYEAWNFWYPKGGAEKTAKTFEAEKRELEELHGKIKAALELTVQNSELVIKLIESTNELVKKFGESAPVTEPIQKTVRRCLIYKGDFKTQNIPFYCRNCTS